ncbi:permease [Balneatrix alpica]|uniref:Permease n=1 Tax=Balneatrix alpica TaxID=75684 RepID=A0ABV5ZDX8_9GAMM|nr:permease [Balneatrix alpica]
MQPDLRSSLEMFAFLAIELPLLFLLISTLVGVLQRQFPAQRIQQLLSADHARSYWLAAALGAITPFCSCSSIPMLKGLIRAQAGFGPMMVFLLVSPLVNPILVVLLLVTFGLSLTSIYVGSALVVALLSAWLLQRLGFARFLKAAAPASTCASHSCGSSTTPVSQPTGCGAAPALPRLTPQGFTTKLFTSQFRAALQEAWRDLRRLAPLLFISILIGSLIYGLVPSELIESLAGSDSPWAIPLAAVIGIPLYISATAMIPLASALLAKGVGAGVLLALIIGSAGASLTELILLSHLFKRALLIAFVLVVISMAISAGYLAWLFY